MIRPDTPLTGAQKKQLAKAVKRAKRDGKIAATAQQTIPYEEMYQNGVCSLGSHDLAGKPLVPPAAQAKEAER